MKAEGMSRELRVAGYELRVTRSKRREARGERRVTSCARAGRGKSQTPNPKSQARAPDIQPDAHHTRFIIVNRESRRRDGEDWCEIGHRCGAL
jgi:hypothetical protein